MRVRGSYVKIVVAFLVFPAGSSKELLIMHLKHHVLQDRGGNPPLIHRLAVHNEVKSIKLLIKALFTHLE